MLVYIINFPSYASVVRVTQLYDLGMHIAGLTTERENPYSVGDHGKVTPMGHTLLDLQELDRTVHVMH